MRILHAPHDIGGNAYYLAQGERAYGVASKNLVYAKQWFGYPANYSLRLPQYANPMLYLRWWMFMTWVALHYDVLHFNFGASFLTYFPGRWIFPDLALWRHLGLATFMTFQGCDSRISRYVMQHLDIKICTNCPSRRELCEPYFDDFRLEVLAQSGRYCDGVFALNPDLLHNMPHGQFLPYCNCDLTVWQPPTDYDWEHAGPVRLLHAPTWPALKGTETVRAVVEALRAEGENVELLLVEKVPHEQVKSLFMKADLFVDQILAGWYGGVAVELMALGKPVVAYIRQEDLRFVPPAMHDDLPVVSANAVTLKEVLRGLIRDVRLRKRVGQQSRVFVEKWHHPQVVAKITTEAYRQALAKRPLAPAARQRLQRVVRYAWPTIRAFAAVSRSGTTVRHLQGWLRQQIRRCVDS